MKNRLPKQEVTEEQCKAWTRQEYENLPPWEQIERETDINNAAGKLVAMALKGGKKLMDEVSEEDYAKVVIVCGCALLAAAKRPKERMAPEVEQPSFKAPKISDDALCGFYREAINMLSPETFEELKDSVAEGKYGQSLKNYLMAQTTKAMADGVSPMDFGKLVCLNGVTIMAVQIMRSQQAQQN